MRQTTRLRLNNGSTAHLARTKEAQSQNRLRRGSFSKGMDKTVHPVWTKSGKAKTRSFPKQRGKKKTSLR